MDVQTPLPIPEANVKAPVLGAYSDFRQYLNDFFKFKLHEHRNSYSTYSYKTFSAAADIRSPNYLKLIIDGERNLSPETARKFARALSLDKEGVEEFLLLVEFGQAQDPLERNRHLKALNEFRMRQKIKQGEITEEKIDRAPTWISWVIHTLVDQKNVDFSIEGLRDVLQGRVGADEIRRTLQQLIDSQALILDLETGRLKKGLVPPNQDDLSPDMIRKIQSELMYLGMESLINGRPNEREIGTLTVCLTEAEFEKLKFEFRHLRKRILKDALIAREQSPGDRVYQLNIQLFPMTNKL